jgi:hypothetical protein
MIRYSLKCVGEHEFEAWFRSSEAYDLQRAAGQVLCAVCGSADVKKAVMAPAVSAKQAPDEVNLSKPASPAEAMLRELRSHIEKNSDYVGRDFADEARRIHQGEADKRSIWGEATVGDAKTLREEGVPVSPIPFMRRGDG